MEPPQPPDAAWPSQLVGVAARRNELMAMQWACDEGGLLWGQPAGEHQTERVGAV